MVINGQIGILTVEQAYLVGGASFGLYKGTTLTVLMCALLFVHVLPPCLSSKIDYDFDDSDSMWLLGKNILLQNGYNQYEVSNFCRNGYECVHNLTYWHHQDYLGIGSGGTGTLYNKDGSGIRWTNVSDIKKYINLWNIPGNTVFYECFSDEKFGLIEKIDLNTSIFEFFIIF